METGLYAQLFVLLSSLLNFIAALVAHLSMRINWTQQWARSAALSLLGVLSLMLFFLLKLSFLLILQILAFVAAYNALIAGIRQYHGRTPYRRSQIYASIVFLGLYAAALLTGNEIKWRVMAVSAMFAYFALVAAFELFEGHIRRGGVLYFSMAMWITFALVNVLRVILASLNIGIDPARPFEGITFLLIFVFTPICTTGAYVGLILLTTERLVAEKNAHVEEILASAERYKWLSDRDPLTEALNRRSFMEGALIERERVLSEKKVAALAILDLDHFKNINDTYGHSTGDAVLVQTVRCLRSALRSHDLLGRMGGEEFLLLLPGTQGKAAHDVCERLRQAISALRIRVGTHELTITASFGVTDLGPEPLDESLKKADSALYQAKESGRNRVVAFS